MSLNLKYRIVIPSAAQRSRGIFTISQRERSLRFRPLRGPSVGMTVKRQSRCMRVNCGPKPKTSKIFFQFNRLAKSCPIQRISTQIKNGQNIFSLQQFDQFRPIITIFSATSETGKITRHFNPLIPKIRKFYFFTTNELISLSPFALQEIKNKI